MSIYNIFSVLPEIPYNCIKYLMDNSELAWKLLAYNDANAWKEDDLHPDLTSLQKGNLIYDGIMPQESARVFMTTGMDSAWTEQSTQLRISILSAEPYNYVVGYLTLAVEIYPHFLVSQLSNYMTRSDMLAQELIRVFNGSDIGGLGKLYFDSSKNPRSKMSIIGSSPFVGKGIVFCNWIV